MYRRVEYKSIACKYAVRIRMLKNDRIQLLNEFLIDHRRERDHLKVQVDALVQFQESEEIKLVTDAGVHFITGKNILEDKHNIGVSYLMNKLRMVNINSNFLSKL